MSKIHANVKKAKDRSVIGSVVSGVVIRTAASAIAGPSMVAITSVGFLPFVGTAALVGVAAWGVLTIIESVIE